MSGIYSGVNERLGEIVMRNTLLVIRHEVWKTLRSAGYVIFAFVIPVVVVLILAGMKSLQGRAGELEETTSSLTTQFEMEVEGYVDQSGLIRLIPDNIPANRLLGLDGEEQAQLALASGEISAYYLIPPDYIQHGKVYYVYPNTRSYLNDGQSWVMARTLLFNLLEGDAALTDRVWDPVWEVTATSVDSQNQAGVPSGEDCSRPGGACESNDLVRYMPSIMAAIFFMAFMTSSSRLFNSIGAEKENRVIEVIMLSVSPRQLLAGKTLGLGSVGLLQTVAWMGAIYFSFNLGGSTLSLPENFAFPAEILIWSLVFFLGGYGLYASLMAGAGALVPKMKEAGAANYIAVFPLFIGYVFGLMAPLAEVSSSPILVFLSIFPLTSPIVMVMRLTDNSVPVTQLITSISLLLVTAYFSLRAAAAMFSAQNLLSGQPFSLRRYFGALAGR
jgi:ABC-2 type transport system permease protein